jgi:tetratricopeptide (TPR) repeat protein
VDSLKKGFNKHMKKTILLLASILTILVVVIIALLITDFNETNLDKNPVFEITYGEKLLSDRQYEEAFGFYHNMVEKGTNLHLAHFGRGNALVGLRRFDEAIQDYSSSLLIQRAPEVLTSRCNAYRIIGEFDKALTDCSEAIRLDNNFSDAYMSLTLIYLDQNNISEARKIINDLVRVAPEHAATHFILSRVQLLEGNVSGALESLSKAIELDPNQPQLFWERGFLYYSNGMISEARSDLGKLINIADAETDGELLYKADTLLKSFSGYKENNP